MLVGSADSDPDFDPDFDPGAERPTSRAWALLVLTVAACVAAVVGSAGWETDNRLERWVDQLPPDPGWEVLRECFGGDESVLVRIDGVDEDRADVDAFLLSVGSRLGRLAAVEQVGDPVALPGVDASNGVPWDALEARPLVRSLDLIGRAPGGSRFDLALIVRLRATPTERAELCAELTELEVDAAACGARMRAAGHPLVAAGLDREARRVERVFVPVLISLAAIAVALLLRSFGLAVIVLLPAVLVSAGSRAVLRALGRDSDLILVTIGPLTFVLMLASTLHVVVRFRDLWARDGDQLEAARHALIEKAPAVALSALTTAAGFCVFLVSGLRSVAELGLSVGGSVLIGVAVMLVVVRTLCAGLPLRAPPRTHRHATRFRAIALFAVRRRVLFWAIVITAIPAGIRGAGSMHTETNGLHYFPIDHPLRVQFLALESEGTPLSSVEVLARRLDSRPWAPDDFAGLGMRERLATTAGAAGVFGPDEILADAGSRGAVAMLGVPLELRVAGRLDRDGEWARWTVFFPTQGAEPSEALVEALRDAAPADGLEVLVAGSVPRMLDMQRTLLGTLISSLGLTLVVTTMLFVLAVRSMRELAIAFLVNISPVAAVLSVAVALSIPLDGATVMVAAVVLGLAVDNTFHLLYAAKTRHPRDRLRCFDRVGGAASISSAALALGFLCLAFSGFAPTARFGFLCAVGVSAALVADLVLLPALWVRLRA